VGERVDTVFVGHIDTVPAYDLDNYEFREKRGIVKGLGVADMKGGCAAMLEAFIRYSEIEAAQPSAALAIVVGEEENSDGIKALLAEHSFKVAIIGEPTGMAPCLGHYGYTEVELRLCGSRRHASLSGREKNATYSMLNVLLRVISYLVNFEGKIRYNIRDIHSSDSGFAVPEKCSAWLDVHIHPDINVNKVALGIRRNVRESINGLSIKKKDLFISTDSYRGYKLNSRAKILTKLKIALDKNSIMLGGDLFESHSDANLMRSEKIKPVILGPGLLSKAHTRDESVLLSQVNRAAQTYFDFLMLL
jgi:acetylornithine deacetylase